MLFFVMVTLTEQKWIILRERQDNSLVVPAPRRKRQVTFNGSERLFRENLAFLIRFRPNCNSSERNRKRQALVSDAASCPYRVSE